MANFKTLWTTGRQDWETPSDLFDALNAEFNFTTDVCDIGKYQMQAMVHAGSGRAKTEVGWGVLDEPAIPNDAAVDKKGTR